MHKISLVILQQQQQKPLRADYCLTRVAITIDECQKNNYAIDTKNNKTMINIPKGERERHTKDVNTTPVRIKNRQTHGLTEDSCMDGHTKSKDLLIIEQNKMHC